MARLLRCVACGEMAAAPSPPTCPSCGTELPIGGPPVIDAGRSDEDQTASDHDQTASDQDQTASDQDQTWSDHDQSASDSDQRSADEDQDAADEDLSAEGEAAQHQRSTAARDRSRQDREAVSGLRDETADGRDETARGRDHAANSRDRSSNADNKATSPQEAGLELQDDILVRARQDRARAAADRAKAADDRAHAAVDRKEAARERAEAHKDKTEAALHLSRSTRDELTGAWMRKFGLEEIARELERSHRTGSQLVLAFLDVDGLKVVNDERGHLAGDALLRLVGETILRNIRPYDIVVRYGGDEFVCGMPNLTIEQAQTRFALIASLLNTLNPDHSISFGLAEAGPEDGLEQLIARADASLLAGRN